MRHRIRIVPVCALLALGVSGGVVGCSAGEEATSGGQATGGPLASGSAAVASTVASAGASTGAAPTGLHLQRDQIRRVYGVAATGQSPDDAAESFRQQGVVAMGIDRDDLRPARLKGSAPLTAAVPASARANGVGLMYDPATGKPKFRLYSYEQQRDGIPVFRAGLRTLVREGGDNPVVWANAIPPHGQLQGSAANQGTRCRSGSNARRATHEQRCFGRAHSSRAR